MNLEGLYGKDHGKHLTETARGSLVEIETTLGLSREIIRPIGRDRFRS